jgi:uncharacterized Zn finger protein
MPWYGYDDDFYDSEAPEPEHDPDIILIEGPVRATSRRGPIGATWWGKRWFELVNDYDSNRLSRGKSYARNGQVRSMALVAGEVSGKVQGSSYHPYESGVEVRILAKTEWDLVLDALSDNAMVSAKFLAGEVPTEVEGIFKEEGFSLFPLPGDLDFYCDCPDWGYPCKHAAAIYYLVAEQLDADPFILFHLRGITRAEFMMGLRERIGAASHDRHTPLKLYPVAFWGQQQEPILTHQPEIPETPPPLRDRKALPQPIHEDLKRLYTAVSKRALAERENLSQPSLPPNADMNLYDIDIVDVPLIPSQKDRLMCILVDAHDFYEQFAAMMVYVDEALDLPFEVLWQGEQVRVIDIPEADWDRGVLYLTVDDGKEKRRVAAEDVQALDTTSHAAIVLGDYARWHSSRADFDDIG